MTRAASDTNALLISSRLPRTFFERDTRLVARDLLGKRLVHLMPEGGVRAGRIVETEAYHGPEDRASHASRGRTPRSAIMFGPAGHAYVYLCYGMHHLLNFVTGEEGFPAAVLIRALDQQSGFDGSALGPGRLARRMGIERSTHCGLDVTSNESPLWVAEGTAPPETIRAAPRIGVDYAGEWAKKEWRFFLDGAIPPNRSR